MKDRLLGCMGQVLQQGVDRISEVGDRANKGQAAGCMEKVLQKGLWQGKESGMGQGGQVSSDKELIKVGRMVEGDQGGQGRRL